MWFGGFYPSDVFISITNFLRIIIYFIELTLLKKESWFAEKGARGPGSRKAASIKILEDPFEMREHTINSLINLVALDHYAILVKVLSNDEPRFIIVVFDVKP